MLEGPYYSARMILPEVFKLIGGAGSYLDVGCGPGDWMQVAYKWGCSPILGYDVRTTDGVRVPPRAIYEIKDVLERKTLPPQQFDLVVCVEVAEHIPPEKSQRLVAYLVRAAKSYILFSSAPPGQGPVGPGPNLHCNEQPPEFWEELFARRGFVPDRRISQIVQGFDRIDPWYRTNITAFVPKTGL